MKRLIIAISALTLGAYACNHNKSQDINTGASEKELQFTVEEAPDWTALFKRDSGWFGGDGIFAIPLDGKENLEEGDTARNLFVFSDTMYGLIENGELQEGFTMVNNSIAILEGHEPDPSKIKFEVKKNQDGQPASLFVPRTLASKEGDYFWLGDGFVNAADNALYLFAYRIVNVPEKEVFGFEEVGNVLIRIPSNSAYPFEEMDQWDIPFHADGPKASLGVGIYVNTTQANAPDPDGYIYIYGVRGMEKELIVARVAPEKMTAIEEWKFWDGEEWTSESDRAAGLGTGVSNELSVSPIGDGKYALVFQQGTLSNTVAMRIGESPIGPFSEDIPLWDCKADLEGSQFFAYNAKAYPSLSKPGELLISYNINSFDFFNDIKAYPNLYRPRFIRVKFE
ncbi:DUF4185 domain-containing protein [Negadavirga shengliensis]|uniref:DUF4185 domain-containing protein n=1 Tax=Negadavirga shengliensis TaxID=1389218 RepID=A0ABV9T1T8_9BACT